ncbi:hydrogenase nickel incorporation protein HypB [Shewanella sp. Isolate8]|uniref:hydrogenase nickel incorporation protein HypB n=1 Tax=Shewanella sp. Isolate8 TaxID=2908529 RepID=UPI001EFD9D94|nr:hydrogenase nickel incorporation protein HypB [Shewanella sp. Isolate8]MCG9746278.1 hydrogenase nickel incorporation protein HypB [Shewanella sp. Isolate8]
MCKDCGCSITRDHSHEHDHHHAHSHEHDHSHAHGHEHSHGHHHDHGTVRSNPQLNDKKTLSVIHKILDKNDHEAAHNRAHFEAHNITAFNLMSSPGSGKTTLLEHLKEYTELNYGVVEGDLETSRDADRLTAKGIPAFQIQTGSACHLDAFMVHDALHHVDLAPLDICFVENVGNLVCPASYDVGTHYNIVLVSVPEGDDKIEKYPVMFRKADLVLITKADLLQHFDFSVEEARAQVKRLNPDAEVITTSIKDGDSMRAVVDWLNAHRSQ